MDLKDSKTYQNLLQAVSTEGRDFAKYCIYADQAEKDGYVEIGEVFRETGGNELHHAEMFLKAMIDDKWQLRHTEDNLKDAATEEDREDSLYVEAAATAREEGFAPIANIFERVAAIEKSHKERYQKILDRVQKGEVFKRDDETTVWYCTYCGHLHVGKEAPKVCPVCFRPQSYFEVRATNY